MEARTPAIASAVVDFTVRLAERRDAGAIRALYNVEVAESTVTFDLVPRTLDEQVEWIDAHSGAHPAVVAIDEAEEVVGFGSLSPFKDRAAYSTTVEDSVYVRRDRRGQGIGRLLLDHLLATAGQRGFTRVSLETGTTDAFAAARSMYVAAGFVPCPPFGEYRATPDNTYFTLVLPC